MISLNLPEIRETATTLAKSTLCPSHFKKPEDALFAILKGAELGLPPVYSLSNISVINGKPSLGTDLMVGLAKKSPEWGGMRVEYSDDQTSCSVTVRRIYSNGVVDESTATFTMDEARNAGLVRGGSPWDKYPARMLKHRATAFAIRDAFPDLLAGTYDPDEVSDVVDSSSANAERAAELGSLRKQLKQAFEGGLMTEAEIRKANLEHLGIEDAKNATNLDKIKEYSLYLARILDGDANNSDPTSFVIYDGSGEIIPPFIAGLSDDQIEYLIGEYVAIEYPNDTAKSRAYKKYGSDPSAFLQHLFDRQSERIAKQAKPEAE